MGMEADIIRAGHILSTTSDWSRDISGSRLGLFLLTFIGHI